MDGHHRCFGIGGASKYKTTHTHKRIRIAAISADAGATFEGDHDRMTFRVLEDSFPPAAVSIANLFLPVQ